ncbi:MAG TPA: SRPBCC family protein [Blastocatellia bacterium]|nr:SRPBCC family protein [Blastocatellia bacterium]
MATEQTRRARAPEREIQSEVADDVVQRDRQYLSLQKQLATKSPAQEKIASGLGWFSIGLGLAEVIAPKAFARFIGAEGRHTALIRVMGLREITAGVGILTNPKPAHWVWARVAGDAVDLACLGAAFSSKNADHGRLKAATAAVIGVTALDIYNAQQLSRDDADRAIRVHTITVNSSPEEVYRFWRDFENLPTFMSHLVSVRITGERRSHWVAKGPAGTTVEWDAEITKDVPGRMIAWKSVEGADVENAGVVRFDPAPGGRGTEVRVELVYNPPAGSIGAGLAKLFGEEPGSQVKGDLCRFKQVIETGEVVHSDSSIHRGMHPAKPAEQSGKGEL